MTKMLKLGIDGSAMVVPNPTGVALAIKRSCEALAALDGVDLRIYYRLSRLKKRRWMPELTGVERSYFVGPLIRRHGIDLFHGPDTRLPNRLPPGVPGVTTIHDFSALQTDKFSKPSFRETRMKHYREAVARSDLILVYTQAIGDELCERFQYPSEKVCVVPLAPAIETPREDARSRARELTGPGPYVLVLGEISVRKNTAFAIQAFLAARESSKELEGLRLLLAGRPGYGSEEAEALISQNPEAVKKLGYVERDVLPALLAQAQILFFPTRYEGFGLPVVEAMSLGVPVIAGACGAVKEVAAGAARLVSPSDIAEASQALIDLASSEETREHYRGAGLKRAAELTWENTAKALLAAYQRVI
ncbi:MAG: glycosyltransferase family 1 protein [Planctomycetota bacterium]|nr:glycosyltransferase family 1 protein [Planctomycetota bacterium]